MAGPLSAASGRRCGRTARRPGRGAASTARRLARASARDRPPRRARRRSQPSTIAGVDLGVELQPDAAPDAERLQAGRRRAPAPSAPGGSVKASSCHANQRPRERRRRALDVEPADLGLAARGCTVAAERGGERLAAEAQPEHRHAGVVRRAQERDLVGDPRVARGVHRAVRAERRRPRRSARGSGHGRRPCGACSTSTCAPRAAAHSPTSPAGASACCSTTSRRSGYPFTRNAPRMNGWMRQK